MEDNKTKNTPEATTSMSSTAPAKNAVKKATTKKAAAPKVKAATKITTTVKTAAAKPAAKKVIAKKTTVTKKTELPKAVEASKPNVVKEVLQPQDRTSTIQKVLNTGKKTGKIVTEAGSIILGSSILTTKAIAGLTTKAGKKAFEIGKGFFSDTTEVVKKNQKTVVDASKTALKETVETIKDSKIIENPLKKK
jgi:hypothetical protein